MQNKKNKIYQCNEVSDLCLSLMKVIDNAFTLEDMVTDPSFFSLMFSAFVLIKVFWYINT